MENILKSIILVLFVSMLSGCFMLDRGNLDNQKSLNEHNIALLSNKLSRYNVKVYRDTNSVMLTLPNRNFFVDNSANFTKSAYNAVDLILALSCYYPESSIAVTGYSKDSCDCGFGKALALERAHRVVQHLRRAGIDANFMYADGKKLGFDQINRNNDGVLVIISKIVE